MKIQVWKLSKIKDQLELTHAEDYPDVISEMGHRFESALGELALKSQEGKIGFRALGNKITKIWNTNLNHSSGHGKFLKATENKRSIPFLMVRWLIESQSTELVVFIFCRELSAVFVDHSAISIEDLRTHVDRFNSVFLPKDFQPIYIAECLEFQRHSIQQSGKVGQYKYHSIVKHEF